MTPRGRLAVALAAGMAAGVTLVGPTPAHAAGARTFAPRYAAVVWGDLVQGGNALLTATGTGPDPAVAWIDIDNDPATVNSSRAKVGVPPGAGIAWAGLYWTGERGWTDPNGDLRCGAFTGPTPASPPATPTPPAAPPPPPTPADPAQVKVRVADGPDTPVTAAAMDELADPAGGTVFQGYADVTGLVKQYQKDLTVTVADVAAAPGRNCGGGWTIFVAYAYPGGAERADSPNPTHAPALRALAVHDGLLEVGAGGTADLVLGGLKTPAKGDPESRLGLVTHHRPRARIDAVTVNGNPAREAGSAADCPSTVDGATEPPACKGLGYDSTDTKLVSGAVLNKTTSATIKVHASDGTAYPGVAALSSRVHTQVDLAVTAGLSPAAGTVGSPAQLTLGVRNESAVDATGVAVTSKLPDGLSLTEAPPAYDTATGVWTVGKVPARSTVTLVLRVRLDRPGNLTTTAEVTASDWPDADSTPADGTSGQDDVAVAALSATAAPTTEEPPPATAQAQAPTDPPGWGLPFDVPPFVLIGLGLVVLGLVMLLAVVIRARA